MISVFRWGGKVVLALAGCLAGGLCYAGGDVIIELINTGTELLLGRVTNTHQQWICSQLADLGLAVTRQVAVADDGPVIQQAVREALSRGPNLVITTGGLGPTSDDLTRDMIAGLLGRKLNLDPAVLAHIEQFYRDRRRPMPASTRVQAMVPEGALVLSNAHGTAPGLVLELAPSSLGENRPPGLLIMLPGPPRELRPMFTQQVIPLLQQRFPATEINVCRILKVACLGESVIEERIAPPLETLLRSGLELGYCARMGEVELRLSSRGPRAEQTVSHAEELIRRLLGLSVFGGGDDLLEAVIVRLLTGRRQTLALAESCTGGLLAHRLTNVSGASLVLTSGLVTYSNEAKQRLLGVRPETLATHGAVSEATAREMAEGARQLNAVDYALAVTGIAGPTGGTREKPVGTVFVGLATPQHTVVRHYLNHFDRETFKWITTQQALDLLRMDLLSPDR